jgi:hypothetical protein
LSVSELFYIDTGVNGASILELSAPVPQPTNANDKLAIIKTIALVFLNIFFMNLIHKLFILKYFFGLAIPFYKANDSQINMLALLASLFEVELFELLDLSYSALNHGFLI